MKIDANNATLSQVLRAVQSQTGASVDVPGSANNERVVAQLGPGQPSDVLRTLLNGSHFDYVILGVAGSPGAVQRIILTPRQNAPAGGAVQSSPTPQAPPAESGDEGAVVENEPEYQNNPEPPVPPPGGFRRPMINPSQGVVQPDGSQDQQQPNGGKTPEQLMQELQQIQQQQQQYQEQLNPANRVPQQ